MHFISTFKSRTKAAAMVCAALLFATSCKEQVVSTSLEPVASQQRKDYLTFKSFEEFKEAYEKMGNQSDVEQKVWDDAHGVTSLRQLFQ